MPCGPLTIQPCASLPLAKSRSRAASAWAWPNSSVLVLGVGSMVIITIKPGIDVMQDSAVVGTAGERIAGKPCARSSRGFYRIGGKKAIFRYHFRREKPHLFGFAGGGGRKTVWPEFEQL